MAGVKDGTLSREGYDSDGRAREILTDVTDGAGHVVTQTTSLNAYGAHPANLGDSFTGVIGANDNDVIYLSPPVIYANDVLIECTAGVIDVEVSADGTNWRLATLRSITAAGVVVSDDTELLTTEHGILLESAVGKFSYFRILQKGATPSNARGRYGVA